MNNNNDIIRQVTEVLENTVPVQEYVRVIKALKRCQEILIESSVHVKRKETQNDMRTYAGALNHFFDDLSNMPEVYVDITGGYDPVSYLEKVGVIKRPKPL